LTKKRFLLGAVSSLHDDPGTELAGGGEVGPVLVDKPLEFPHLHFKSTFTRVGLQAFSLLIFNIIFLPGILSD
jgi:hypothetical protein